MIRVTRTRFSPCQRGLTLVEVLVAVTILSLALMTYLSVLQTSHDAVNDGDEFTVAAQAIDNQIAQLQGLGYSGVSSSDGITNYTVPRLKNSAMTVTVGPLGGNASNTNIVEVDVKLTWTPRKVGSKAITSTVTQSVLMSNHP